MLQTTGLVRRVLSDTAAVLISMIPGGDLRERPRSAEVAVFSRGKPANWLPRAPPFLATSPPSYAASHSSASRRFAQPLGLVRNGNCCFHSSIYDIVSRVDWPMRPTQSPDRRAIRDRRFIPKGRRSRPAMPPEYIETITDRLM